MFSLLCESHFCSSDLREEGQAYVAPSLTCTNLEVVGVCMCVCCQGRTVLWTVGLKEDVKDNIQKDGLVIIQVFVGYGFCVDVESLNSIKVGSFFVAV